MKLSIVFPAYNEEKRIIPVLNNYYSFFTKKFKKDFELIIIPNNCDDKTFNVVKDFSKNKENILIKNIPYYVGKGGAVMKGFKLAKGDLIGFVDSDESTSPKEFFKLYSNIKDYKGIIASRKIKGSKIIPKRKFGKRISSLGFNLAIKTLFNFKYKDTQCGAKIFKKKVAKYLARNFTETGWIFDIDLLNLCKKKNYNIKEFPIIWKDNEDSKLTTIEGVKALFRAIRYRFISKNPKH